MTRPRRVTITEVARTAGVSVATVSRAVRGFDNVSPDLAAHVRAVAAQLGYRANQHASHLRTGNARAVNLLVPRINKPYYAEIIAGTEAALSDEGYDTFVSVVGDDHYLDRALDQAGPHGRVDGIILVDLAISPRIATQVAAWNGAVVTAGIVIDGFPSVTVDDVRIGELATNHLLELGHERIALAQGKPHSPDRLSSAERRRIGFENAMRAAGREPDPELISIVPFSIEGGITAATAMIGRLHRPTAVFCMGDEIAFGVWRTFGMLGFRLPRHCSIIGVDDSTLADFTGLSTVRQPVSNIGAEAAHLLLDELRGTRTVDHLVLPVELVARASTTALRR